MSDKNIIIAFGGRSPEHEVSVLSAMQAIKSLSNSSYNILPLYVSKSGEWLTGDELLELEHYQNLDELESKAISCTFSHNDLGQPVLLETEKKGLFSSAGQYPIHAVIPAFHGSEGENGAFQGCCEMYNIAYAGSGVFASSIGMDKVKAKELCRAHDIPVVDGIDFFESQWEEQQESILEEAGGIGFPLIVKPVTLGSSIGVAKAKNKDELIEKVEHAFRYDQNLMIEEAVAPLTEINCAVLGHANNAEASVCERPLAQDETLSFKDKYQSNGEQKGMASADREVPADISDAQTDRIQKLSLKIFNALRASGIARLDFLVNDETNDVYFNEINTIPGSFSFYLWEESGMNMRELMLQLIDIATTRHQQKTGRIRSYDTNLLDEKAIKGIKGLKGSND